MIEDSPEVLARMPARTARLWLCDHEVFDLDVCLRALRGLAAPPSKPESVQSSASMASSFSK